MTRRRVKPPSDADGPAPLATNAAADREQVTIISRIVTRERAG